LASTIRFYWFTGTLASAIRLYLGSFRTSTSTVRFYLGFFGALASAVRFHLRLAGTLRTAIRSHLGPVVWSVHVLARLALVHRVKISISPI
ncbi:hypothetical protein, partial [uncultured Robinsoniella sp.]|uniref:hypothetical protein n=1 Tax=uncultured Robinsoniella sp. TaxID=904190 RepID=UPI00374EF7E2